MNLLTIFEEKKNSCLNFAYNDVYGNYQAKPNLVFFHRTAKLSKVNFG